MVARPRALPRFQALIEVAMTNTAGKRAWSNSPNLRIVPKKLNYKEMTDEELIIACQQRDEVALKHLLNRHRNTIITMFHKLAPDWKDSSDLVQEVFIRIWRYIGQLKNPHSFKTWLHQIVTNLFYDELRKRPRKYQILSIDEPVSFDNGPERGTRDIIDNSQQPETNLLNSELSDALEKALSSIPAPFRTAAVLRDVEGLSYEEIAQLTDTELGTVKSRISRARLKIQKRLSHYLRDCA